MISSSSTSNNSTIEYARLTRPNHISLQDHPFICSIETSLIPLLVYRNGILSNNLFQIHRLLFILSFDYLYLYYIPFIPKTPYSLYLYSSLIFFLCYGVLFINPLIINVLKGVLVKYLERLKPILNTCYV